MTQTTVKIHNPTGTRVAYLARDLRVNVPSGESTHTVASNKLDELKAHLAKHYPLLKVVADSPAAEPEPTPEPEAASGGGEPAEKPSGGKSGRRGKGGRKASQAKAEAPDTEQTSEAGE